MRPIISPRIRGSLAVAGVVLLAFASLTLSGCACTPLDQPNEEPGGVESTGTVQAELPVETTGTVEATTSVTPTTTPKPAAPAIWPAKAATFAKNFKKAAWYPAYVPKGYQTDSIDIVEMGTKTGLVLDIVYLNGDKVLQFTQGSPTDRKQDIVSAGKVPWGTDTAVIMYQDPEDSSSPPMIIYSKGGTYIELFGDPSLAELKKVAASMVPVK
jgi:hypothetical protein